LTTTGLLMEVRCNEGLGARRPVGERRHSDISGRHVCDETSLREVNVYALVGALVNQVEVVACKEVGPFRTERTVVLLRHERARPVRPSEKGRYLVSGHAFFDGTDAGKNGGATLRRRLKRGVRMRSPKLLDGGQRADARLGCGELLRAGEREHGSKKR
jgi:hypothetical protein